MSSFGLCATDSTRFRRCQTSAAHAGISAVVVMICGRHRSPVDNFQLTKTGISEPLTDFVRVVPMCELGREAVARRVQRPRIVIGLDTRIAPMAHSIEK